MKPDDQTLPGRLVSIHKKVYKDNDAKKLAGIQIHLKQKELGLHKDTHSLRELFSKRYRVRFFLGCFLNFFRQLGGINILLFFSTQLFDDVSGNGPLITVLVGAFMCLGAILSIFTAKMKRRLTFGLALIVQGFGTILIVISV